MPLFVPFPRDSRLRGPILRWGAAVLLAPVLPAALFGLVAVAEEGRGGSYADLVEAAFLVNGYPAILTVGCPAFLLLRRLLPAPAAAALAGGLVGALPWLAIGLLGPDPANARFGTCAGLVDGRPTWCGSLASPGFLAAVFVLGALGGVVYALLAGSTRSGVAAKPR